MPDFNNAPKLEDIEAEEGIIIQAALVDPVGDFQAAMADAGFNPGDRFRADGKYFRFGKNKNQFGLMFPDGLGGVYGDWSTGEKYYWFANGNKPLTTAQRAELDRKIAKAKKKYEAEQARKHEAARVRANQLWDTASPAPNDHSYLKKKGVKSYDLKIDRSGQLIVPMRDKDGVLWSLQTIGPDGAKRFLKGGKIKGNYFTIPGGDNVYICEGFATGASIAEATDGTVVVAFNSGNLKPVAKAVIANYPKRQIVIAADNDQFTDNNPGKKAANEAAKAIGGARVIVPEFSDLSNKPTDFNDLARLEGPQAVKDQIKAGTANPLQGAALIFSEFENIENKPRLNYLHPWLKEESINLIYGWRGAGKTWFGLSIGDAITRGGTFGKWDCQKAVPCLYLDGEMTIGDNQERSQGLNLSADRQQPFHIYCEHYANKLGLPPANLTNDDWRGWMKDYLLELGVKVWIADNIASLAPGLDENVRQDWDPINQWLLDLRFAGITSILLHHEGKAGVQRGTSAREDNLDITIRLKKPGNYKVIDGCRFIADFEKSRIAHKYLGLIDNVEFQLIQTDSGLHTWTTRKANVDRLAEVLKGLGEGKTQQIIATELNFTPKTIKRDVNKAKEFGYLDDYRNLTEAGRQYIAQHG